MISDEYGDERLHALYVESSDPSMNRFHSRSPLVKLDKRTATSRPPSPLPYGGMIHLSFHVRGRAKFDLCSDHSWLAQPPPMMKSIFTVSRVY
jgi:hypothetical protein